ncbi:MAG: cytochrome c3 family protein [Bacteroidales bacterium]
MNQRNARALPLCCTLLLFLLLPFLRVSAQLSPGDLAEAHKQLEGMSNCTKCHVLRKKVSNEKCLACHTEIDARIKAGRGYHASSEVKGHECASCHNDHHGRKFEMIRFDEDNFDHGLAGYTLQGKHGQIDCNQCHKKEFIAGQDLKERSGTYLGLEKECLSCHTDVHQGSLGADCASCHDFNQFRPAPGFYHDNTPFPLKGEHREVDCAKCHKTEPRNGQEFQVFKGVDHSNCTDCHRDVHENRFGQNCTKCHTEVSFHQIRNTGNFNHATTGFPLKGKHASVTCTSCHKNGYTAKLKHNRCTDCHADYHRKQFITENRVTDCRQCHTENGFSPTLFTIERHNESPFALSGAHLAVPCFDCHRREERWEFRQIGINCNDCHEDIHAQYLDKKYYPDQNCRTCHTDTRWSEVSFDHSRTGYRLEGAHQRQTCRACHFKPDEQGRVVQRFSGLTNACLECHREAHHEQFGTEPTLCLKCHDYFDWKAGMFNHNQTAFPLDGRHKDVACAKCHPKMNDDGQPYTLYKPLSIQCESCH